jgi:hypothetical protein
MEPIESTSQKGTGAPPSDLPCSTPCYPKTTLSILLGLLVWSCFCAPAAELLPPGTIDFTGATVLQVLELYKLATGVSLVSDSRVRTVQHEITLQAKGKANDEAAKLLEKALLEQAGIVITHLDGKRASVTYNDALPIAKPNNTAK